MTNGRLELPRRGVENVKVLLDENLSLEFVTKFKELLEPEGAVVIRVVDEGWMGYENGRLMSLMRLCVHLLRVGRRRIRSTVVRCTPEFGVLVTERKTMGVQQFLWSVLMALVCWVSWFFLALTMGPGMSGFALCIALAAYSAWLTATDAGAAKGATLGVKAVPSQQTVEGWLDPLSGAHFDI